jgi:hypothetical protein
MTMNRTKRTRPREKKFLNMLRQTCNVGESARAAGVGRSTAYEWRQTDPSFLAAWNEAEADGVDLLEKEAWRRAVEGWDRPIIHKGRVTGTYKVYSDKLIELLLKAHRPERFKDRVANEHSGPDGAPIAVDDVSALNPVELSQRLASILFPSKDTTAS